MNKIQTEYLTIQLDRTLLVHAFTDC